MDNSCSSLPLLLSMRDTHFLLKEHCVVGGTAPVLLEDHLINNTRPFYGVGYHTNCVKGCLCCISLKGGMCTADTYGYILSYRQFDNLLSCTLYQQQGRGGGIIPAVWEEIVLCLTERVGLKADCGVSENSEMFKHGNR